LVTKALQLTEYIVKDGNARFIKDMHKHLFIVKALEEFNHFTDNTDRGKPIRGLAKRIVMQINDSMKNIEILMKQTKQKKLGQYNGEARRTAEERDYQYAKEINRQQQMAYNQKLHPHERPEDFQKNYFKEEYGAQEHAEQPRHQQQKRPAPPAQARNAQSSVIDPQLYQHPNADKEVLNLVESQFGKGFLELNFDDDDADVKSKPKKPLSNPSTKKHEEFQFEYQNPKSVKYPTKNRRTF
jgi:hypothetical protein